MTEDRSPTQELHTAALHPDAATPTAVPGPASGSDAEQSKPASGFTGWWANLDVRKLAMDVSVWVVSGIVTFLAASHQVAWAKAHDIEDGREYLFPVGLELFAINLFAMGAYNARRGRRPYGMWMLGALVGGFAVYINLQATTRPDGSVDDSGMVFGAFSAGALLLWFLKMSADYKIYLSEEDLDGVGKLWMIAPRLALRANMVKIRLRKYAPTTSDAIALAEVWLSIFDDAKGAINPRTRKKIKRSLRARTAWRSVLKAAGHPVADLPTFTEIQTVNVMARPALASPPAATELPVVEGEEVAKQLTGAQRVPARRVVAAAPERPARPVRVRAVVPASAPADTAPTQRAGGPNEEQGPSEQSVPAAASAEPKTTTPLTTDDILGVASLILAVTESYPNWMTDTKLPSERAAITAINEVRQREGDSFNSKKRVAIVLRAMAQIKAQPPHERQQVMDQLGPLASIPS